MGSQNRQNLGAQKTEQNFNVKPVFGDKRKWQKM
jgi:hypothetical protein